MPKIAFFSNDAAGLTCARLVALGLSQLPGRTLLAAPCREAPADALERVATVGIGQSPNAYDVERLVTRAIRSGSDVVAALPLDCVRDAAVRLQFDAAITVGEGQVAAARALRAARYEAATSREAAADSRADVPAWFLAGSDQSVLMTKATLAPVHGPRLPFATRALPMVLPRLTRTALDRLEAGAADETVIATGTLLAALSLAIAFDPSARRIEAADLAAMMAARDTAAERDLSERLVGLADAYGRAAEGDFDALPDRTEARPRMRRPRASRAVPGQPGPARASRPRAVRSYGY